jgi:bifunctional non-homologous end joining protein LigD
VTPALRAERRTVAVSRPQKRLFADDITKADLARYYETVAGAMLPHLAGRPLNFERYPDGVDGRRIFQQHIPRYFPDWIDRVTVPKANGTVTHVVARDSATLVYLAGQACITFHPWLSRADRLDRPDRLVIDLDPSDRAAAGVTRAAREMGTLLRELGLQPFVMTTGSRGFHVVVPLQRRAGFDTVRDFARDVARLAAARDPAGLTVEQRKAKRGGRILLDVMRNTFAQTAVAPYAVRARSTAPVATPLAWEELSDRGPRSDHWTLRTIPGRLERDGDPWRDLPAAAQALGAARRRLDHLLAEALDSGPPARAR